MRTYCKSGRLSPVESMIERDNDIPLLRHLLAELDTARAIGAGLDRRAA